MRILICLLAAASGLFAQCSYSISPQSADKPARAPGAITGTISVTATPGCAWTAASNVSWIQVNFGQAGSGNGSVGYSVDYNTYGTSRTGTLTVAGQTFTVNQAAAVCDFALTPAFANLQAAGGAGSLQVKTTCSWVATSDSSWLTITSPATGTGAGTISYSAAANNTGAARQGRITGFGGQAFLVSQAGLPCTITLSPGSDASVPYTGRSGSFTVSATAGCAWNAVSSVAWISVTSGSGTGPGAVNYTVLPNNGPARTGAITVGSVSFSVTQAGGPPCSITLTPSADASVPVTGKTGTFLVAASTTCSWTASATASWITINSGAAGTGPGNVTYTVAPNGGSPREGSITVGTAEFRISQGGIACTFTLSPVSGAAPASGGSGSLTITATSSGCAWTAASDSDWLTFSPASGSGTGNLNWSAAPNQTSTTRTGTLTIGGVQFRVTQAAGAGDIVLSAIANAANYRQGAVSPGEIIVLFGTNIGPADLVTLQVTPDGRYVSTNLGQTMVFFDQTAAAMVYSSSGQVSAIVPYDVATKSSVQLHLEYRGRRSNTLTIPVAAAAPGIFTLNAQGTGQAAALNADYGVNGPAAPIARGSYLMLFATGEGATDPQGQDGLIVSDPLPKPKLGVTVRIGGANAPVLYAGGAPGLVSGVLQINVVIPADAPVGDAVPITVQVGDFVGQTGATVAVGP